MSVDALSDLGVLIVDCQTTGASPAHGVVLELGWGVANASCSDVQQLQAHWVSLPPGHAVDLQVRRLTGFDEGCVTDARMPGELWERLRATTGFSARMPAAIHFARFELAFLRDWASRFEPAIGFPLDTVCLHAIACRLYPDLPRRSLRALAGYLGHGVDPARRSMGHVEATAFIWRKLVSELASLGIRTWSELGDWLAQPLPAAGSRPRKRRYPLASAKYRTLPDQPGVYRLLRSNGDVLYVGKAASLRKRVASHFTAGSGATERALEMLTQVHDIQITPTQTALEAALLEIENIKALHPPYNVQLVEGDLRTWFTNRGLDAAATQPDDTHRYGPLPSTFSVRAFGAIRALASGETATLSLRARAVGAPPRFAPDEAVFAAGFACFAKSHSLEARGGAANLRRALLIAAKKLILAGKPALASTSDPAVDAESHADVEIEKDETIASAGELDDWDCERVVRHLERAVVHAHRLLARARWLCLLHDSAVVFAEPPSRRPRLLLIDGGCLVDARDRLPDDPIPEPAVHRRLRERKAAFDRSRYDRLRTLTTELKRILRDDGSVSVRVGRGRWLHSRALNDLLIWV